MITINNYFKRIKGIKIADLPEALKENYQFTKEATEGHKNWNYYEGSEEVKETVDNYLIQLNKFLNSKTVKKVSSDEIHSAAIDLIKNYVFRGDSLESIKAGSTGSSNGEYSAMVRGNKIIVNRIKETKVNAEFLLSKIFNEIKNSMPEDQKDEIKPSKEKPVKRAKPAKSKQGKTVRISTANARATDKIDEEVKFIKRYALLHNKTKTKAQILNFINALQRAIVEKRIRKTSPYAKEIMGIQNGLVNVYGKIRESAIIELEKKALERYIEIAGSEKIRLSTQYLKRFIGIHGKTITKDKAQSLFKLIDMNIKKGNIKSADPYFEKVLVIQKSLNKFIKLAKSGETVQVHEQILNGLNGALEGCDCEVRKVKKKGNLGELPVKTSNSANIDDGIMTVDEARKQKFNPVPITGEWLRLIGEFCLPSKFFVYGSGGSGKTTFVLLFTQYLASLGYNILYVAGEQYNTPTFTKLLNDLNIHAGENFQITQNLEVLSPKDFDFVVLDSKDHLEINIDDFIALTSKYPKQSFIVLSQGVKNGNFRGSERWRNTVDVMIKAENGIIQTGADKNRWGGSGEMRVF